VGLPSVAVEAEPEGVDDARHDEEDPQQHRDPEVDGAEVVRVQADGQWLKTSST